MITVLGSLLTLERSVLEQRLFVEKCYESFKNSDMQLLIELEKPTYAKAAELVKRKRNDVEVIYVEASSEEESDTDTNLPKKRTKYDNGNGYKDYDDARRKNKNNNTSTEKLFKLNQKRVGGKMNTEQLLMEDGLNYSFNSMTGNKFDGFSGGGKARSKGAQTYRRG
jgi:hypothetical protein